MTTTSPVRPHILLVEDSLTQAVKLQHLLEQLEYTVSWVESAEQALDELQTSHPCLLITALNLPGMSGETLCRQLRRTLNSQTLPILLLTSASVAQLDSQLIECGADDFVCKTSDGPKVFLKRVNALIGKGPLQPKAHVSSARLGAVKMLLSLTKFPSEN